jgi:hypothetical protein
LISHTKIVVDGPAQSVIIYTSTAEDEMTRKNTNMLLDMVAEGTLDKDQLIRDLLMWMSESEVEDFASHSGILDDEDEVDDSMDGDHDSAMASAGWGTDEDYGYSGDVE